MLTLKSKRTRLVLDWPQVRAKLFKTERLAQTLASMCWIASVFSYGITSNGDWLQLMAASSWFVSNMVAVLSNDDKPEKS